MKAIFITGTDTHVGKTFVSTLLLAQLNHFGLKTFAIKPIASGCHYGRKKYLQNEDALILQSSASLHRDYQIVNPIALEKPMAPQLAALEMGITLSKNKLKESILSSMQSEADVNIIEGVGGWSVPLNDEELFSEAIVDLAIPVVLVVGIKLGCLNHAILTYQSIVDTGVPFIGWIANCLSPEMLQIDKNIETLQCWIKHPCLGVVPFQKTNHNGQKTEFINMDIVFQKNILA